MIAQEVLARFTADTAGLRRGTGEAAGMLRSLGQSGQQTGATLASGFQTASRANDSFVKGLSNTNAVLLKLGTIIGTSAIAWGGLDRLLDTEDATKQMRRMGLEVEQVDAILKQVDKTFDGTPFANPTGFDISAQLYASNVELSKVPSILGTIADFSTHANRPIEEMAMIFTKIASQGKVTGMELMQLAQSGIPLEILAKSMGTTAQEMSKLAAESQFTASKFFEAAAGIEMFAGAAKTAGDTTRGAWTNTFTAMKRIAADFLVPFFGENGFAVQNLKGITAGIKGLSPAAKELGQTFAGFVIPAVERAKSALSDLGRGRNMFGGMSDNVTELFDALSKAAVVAVDFAVTLGSLAPPIAIMALRAATEVVSALTNMLTKSEGVMKIFMAMFAANRIMGWARSMSNATMSIVAQTTASLRARQATLQRLGAERALGVQLRANAMGMVDTRGGVASTTLTSSWNARNAQATMVGGMAVGSAAQQQQRTMIALGRQNEAMIANINKQFVAGSVAATRFGRSVQMASGALRGLGITPAMLGITALIGAFMMASDASRRAKDGAQEYMDELLKGADTAQEKVSRLTSDIGNMWNHPSNNAMYYSGGFMSDVGGLLQESMDGWKAIFSGQLFSGPTFLPPDPVDWSPVDWETAYKEGDDSWKKWIDDFNENFGEFIGEAKRRSEEYEANIRSSGNSAAMAAAEAKDKIRESLKDLYAEEAATNMGMFNPFSEFADQSGVSLDEMMSNMESNAQAVIAWRSNLAYLVASGNEDIAAYFAELGPMSAQALSELTTGTEADMDRFRELMTLGFEVTGADSEKALKDGLAKIPGVIDAAGLDVLDVLSLNKPEPRVMTDALLEAYTQALDGVPEAIEWTLYAEIDVESDPNTAQAAIEAAQEMSREIGDTLSSVDPKVYMNWGITPEMLQIPRVQQMLYDALQADSEGGAIIMPIELEMIARDPDLMNMLDRDARMAPKVIELEAQLKVDDEKKQLAIDTAGMSTVLDGDIEFSATPEQIAQIQELVTGGGPYEAQVVFVPVEETILPETTPVNAMPAAPQEMEVQIVLLPPEARPGYAPPEVDPIPVSWTIDEEPVNAIPPGIMQIEADTDQAVSDASSAVTDISAMSAAIGVSFIPNMGAISNAISNLSRRVVSIGVAARANRFGSIMSFADGGMLPANAMIERDGANLVQWAEPGTGGEAFIPLAQSNRARSEEIWKRVGEMFGYKVMEFAAGGIITPTPVAWSFNSNTKSKKSNTGSSTTASSMPGRSSGGKAAQTWLELIANMYAVGDASAQQYIDALSEEMARQKKYSDEWTTNAVQVNRLRDEIMSEELRQRDLLRSRQDAMNEVGDLSNASYINELNNRLSMEEKYSDGWMSIWRTINSVQDAIAREAEEQQRIADEAMQRALTTQDYKYELGEFTDLEYKSILESRLAQEQKYSDEWMGIWRQLENVKHNIEWATQEAVDQARLLEDSLNNLGQSVAGALISSFDAVARPIKDQTDVLYALGADAVDLGSLQGFYDHTIEAAERWQSSLTALSGMGLDDKFLSELSMRGPDFIEFAESIISGGEELVRTINASENMLNKIASDTGQQWMAEIGQMGSTTITVGDVRIEIPADLEGGLSEANMRKIIEEAMKELALTISQEY